MKIKTTKQMRLDELIKHVWENEKYPCAYMIDGGGRASVLFDGDGDLHFDDYTYGHIRRVDTFTVEVEEELTEETEFKELVELYYDCDSNKLQLITAENVSISSFKKAENKPFKSLAIYHKDTLIWSKDTGIPESGVLEVETDVQ